MQILVCLSISTDKGNNNNSTHTKYDYINRYTPH
eukprot:UN10786